MTAFFRITTSRHDGELDLVQAVRAQSRPPSHHTALHRGPEDCSHRLRYFFVFRFVFCIFNGFELAPYFFIAIVLIGRNIVEGIPLLFLSNFQASRISWVRIVINSTCSTLRLSCPVSSRGLLMSVFSLNLY